MMLSNYEVLDVAILLKLSLKIIKTIVDEKGAPYTWQVQGRPHDEPYKTRVQK